jgi:hypothetical protein
MNFKLAACVAMIGLGSILANQAHAQTLLRNTASYALKSGESVEVSELYWINTGNCQSLLTATPEVTVIDGPPGVTASISEGMVTPRAQQCAKPIKGAKLKLSADKIEDQSISQMTLRIKYKTKDGERQQSLTFNLTLFP